MFLVNNLLLLVLHVNLVFFMLEWAQLCLWTRETTLFFIAFCCPYEFLIWEQILTFLRISSILSRQLQQSFLMYKIFCAAWKMSFQELLIYSFILILATSSFVDGVGISFEQDVTLSLEQKELLDKVNYNNIPIHCKFWFQSFGPVQGKSYFKTARALHENWAEFDKMVEMWVPNS